MWAAMGATKDAQNGAMSGGINVSGYSKDYAGQGYGTGSSADDYAWHEDNSDGQTHPVGEKLPNELGFYDMSGNVWEWCFDIYATYPAGLEVDYTGRNSGNERIIKGSSIFADFSNISGRFNIVPTHRYYNVGFRVCKP